MKQGGGWWYIYSTPLFWTFLTLISTGFGNWVPMESQFMTTRSVQLWCSIYQGFLLDFLLFLISSRIKILSFMHKQQFNFPNNLWHEIGSPYQKILLFINQDYLKDGMQDFLAKVSEVLLTFSRFFVSEKCWLILFFFNFFWVFLMEHIPNYLHGIL